MALCTASFYAVVMWTVYIALEPYVRRRWPQTLISWSTVLIGRVRDAVVGRDVLIGCAAGVGIALLDRLLDLALQRSASWAPDLDDTMPLLGARGTLALVLGGVTHAFREALLFLFFIFLLRAVVRNQWVAGVAFALLFASLNLGSPNHPLLTFAVGFAVLFGLALLVLRWGLLALAVANLIANAMSVPVAQPAAWYFGSTVLVFAAILALAGWGFHISLGGRKLWKEDFFG
jgi:serine/threonine-protein kinase